MLFSVTFLLTDVEGSTRRWEKQATDMQAAMERHDALFFRIVFDCRGKLVKERGEGDSHFITFENPFDAALCAVQLQRELSKTDWKNIGEVKVRMAIHTGEAQFRENDFYGPTVNRCARIRGAAHGGQIIISQAVQEAIKDNLPEGTRLINLGEHRFKDLLEPENVYELVVEGLPRIDKPLNSIDPAKSNLPVQLTSFVGREKVLANLYNLVKKHRLVTLRGAGGSGKTRLSLQSGAELTSEFKDGVWFIPLVDLRDPSLLGYHLANSLPLVVGDKDPLQAIVEEFRELHALLIVDNCEHLTKAVAPTVNRLLKECRHLHVMATSREPIAVAGEYAYLVPGLEHDLKDAEPTLENVAKLEAVALLRDRASSRTGGTEILTHESAQIIAALVKRLEGLPLAIEQAAANLSTLSLRNLYDRLDKHLAMFEVDDEGVEDRHRTIEGAIDWSYQMLEPAERELFAKLSIFDGGASADAIESICCENEHAAASTISVLRRLSLKSMLMIEDTPWGDNRFRMLEPIREFSQAKRDPAQEPQLRDRHFCWMHDLCTQAAESGFEARDGYYKKRVISDFNNVRSALVWAETNPTRSTEFAELCIALYGFWVRESHVREGASWMQKAIDLSIGIPDKLRGDLLNKLGGLMYFLGNYPAAETSFAASLEIWKTLNDAVKTAACLNNLALIASHEGRHSEAIPFLAEAASLFEKSGDHMRLANCLQNRAVCEEMLGDVDGAIAHFEAAIEIFRREHSESDLQHVIQNVLGAYWGKGLLLQHAWLLEESVQLLIKLGEKFSARGTLEVVAAFCFEKDDPRWAAQFLGAATKAGEQSEAASDERSDRFRKRLEANAIGILGKSDFNRWLKAGHTWSVKDALKKALERVSDHIATS